jgi:hypothetical protein
MYNEVPDSLLQRLDRIEAKLDKLCAFAERADRETEQFRESMSGGPLGMLKGLMTKGSS